MDEIALNVELHSDSGHHFYFVPIWAESRLSAEKRTAANVAEMFNSNCNREGLRNALRGHIPIEWTPGRPGYEWLKLRRSAPVEYYVEDEKLGKGPFILEGVWICIETNTGGKNRGNIYHRETDVGVERVAEAESTHSRYVSTSPEGLPKNQSISLAAVFEHFESLAADQSLPNYRIDIGWNQFQEENDVTVRLLVDYGNSRTVAAILENAPNAMKDDQLSMVTTAVDLNSDIQDASGFLVGQSRTKFEKYIADSWMVMRRPIFEGSEAKPRQELSCLGRTDYEKPTFIQNMLSTFRTIEKTVRSTNVVYVKPDMFRELSFATIGQPAYDLVGDSFIDKYVNYFLSAPKRYCWDHDPPNVGGGTKWYMVDQFGKVVPLQGDVLRFLPVKVGTRFRKLPKSRREGNPADIRNSDSSNSETTGFIDPKHNDFPRSDAMVWSALRIIESAYRQLQSENFRRERAVMRRRLTEVVLTYPSGWTYKEKESFLNAWRSAANIFFWSRFEDPDSRLSVRLGLDEAVASQLPVVFADIVNLGQNGINRWLDLFGKVRGGTKSCRVLTIDIGGGTTDTSVVEYTSNPVKENATPVLVPRVLMTDSSYHAGDRLVQSLTDELLLPLLCKGFSDDQKDAVFRVLQGTDQSPVQASKRAVLNRTVFMPMILYWLNRMSKSSKSVTSGGIISATADVAGCHFERREDLNRAMTAGGLDREFWPNDTPIDVNVSDIRVVVREWLDPVINNSSLYLGGLDCDFVVLTGKPSEIETVKAEMQERLPIDVSRIAFAKGFYAGKHLPLTKEGGGAKQIADAKLVTVTGAIIREASSEDSLTISTDKSGALLKELIIEAASYDESFVKNYWHRQYSNQGIGSENCVMTPEEDSFKLLHNSTGSILFWRSKFKKGPKEPVYELRKVVGKNQKVDSPIKFKIERHIRRQEGSLGGEKLVTEELQLVEAVGDYTDGTKVETSQWQLRVRTIEQDHWLDNPRFQRHQT